MEKRSVPVVPRNMLFSFILVTCLFSLWGFANDITNPLVKAFKDVFVISNTQSSFVQMAFYGGYATMALPAALFIRKFSYKSGILVGLALYAFGALLSFPAAAMVNFNLFLIALYILTFGLAFLETTANPYILSMGEEKTATQRLNLAQAFNPIGSLTGMTVAIFAILGNLQVQDFRDHLKVYQNDAVAQVAIEEGNKPEVTEKAGIVDNLMLFLKLETKVEEIDPSLSAYLNDNATKRLPYLSSQDMADLQAGNIPSQLSAMDPELKDEILWRFVADGCEVRDRVSAYANLSYDTILNEALQDFKANDLKQFQGVTHKEMQIKDLKVVRTPYVVIGLIVLGFFCVFAVSKLPDAGGHEKKLHLAETFRSLLGNKRYLEGVLAQTFYVGAQIMCWTFIIHYATDLLGFSFAKAQTYNVVAMIIFCSSRFICTFLLKYFSPGHLLMSLSIAAMGLTLGTVFLQGMPGLYCLVGISACMSLMFPTIYGIALDGMGEEAKIASAGLIFAIVGGCLMPPLQGRIIDMGGIGALEGVRVSFFLPFICFVVIALFGFRTFTVHRPPSEEKYVKA